MRKLILPFILICALFCCKSASQTSVATKSDTTGMNNDLLEKYWKLTELYGKPVAVDTTYIKEPHLIFQRQENKVIGHGGCNSLSGTYELKEGNGIIIANVIATRMSCPSISVELELLKVLAMADNYNLNGNVLVLNKARMAPLARFEAVNTK